jgi:hypothetical protein
VISVGSSCVGLGFNVELVQTAGNGFHQFLHTSKAAVPDAILRDKAEDALHQIHLRRGGTSEVQHEAILSIDLALGVIRRSIKLITFLC